MSDSPYNLPAINATKIMETIKANYDVQQYDPEASSTHAVIVITVKREDDPDDDTQYIDTLEMAVNGLTASSVVHILREAALTVVAEVTKGDENTAQSLCDCVDAVLDDMIQRTKSQPN